MRLARKLTLALVFGVCAVLTLHGFLSARRELEFFEADTQRDARVMARTLVAVLNEIWRAQGRDRALQFLEEANEREEVVNFHFVSLDPASPMVPVIPRERIGELVPGRVAVFRDADEGKIVTYVPLPVDGSTRSAIEVSSSLAEQHRYVRRSMIANGITTAATTGVAAALTILLGAYFVGRPMRMLIDKARRIGAGDLSGPLTLRQRDELGELAGEINAMCERLAEERIARMRAVDELRHAHRLAVVGRLGTGIAHELGTPLHVVTGWANMIAHREVEGDAAVEAARNVSSAAERMTKIIRQLLDFARRRTMQKEPLELDGLVRQTIALLTPIAEKRRVELVQTEGELLDVDADGAQLQQALTNLIMNGIDAMSDGGRLTVSIARVQATPPADVGGDSADWACLSVCDEGPGVAEEHLDEVFEPFFTTKDVGEGTGLGLSVTYGIVREHGGFITVTSRDPTGEGHGACFRIYLPLRGTT